MATLNFHELFVVTSGGRWSPVSACSDVVYTDTAEAEVEMEKLKGYYPNSGLHYNVSTLDDYIREVQSQARADGRDETREGY